MQRVEAQHGVVGQQARGQRHGGQAEQRLAQRPIGDARQGRILVVPGFAIPWDDPTRW